MLEVLAGRRSVAGAAADLGVTRQTVYNWKAAFVAAGSAAIASTREDADADASTDRSSLQVEAAAVAIVDRLRLVNPAELDTQTLEAVRCGAGIAVSRFCELTGIPRRTYYARRAASADDATALFASRLDAALADVWGRHPDWGARRVWQHLTDVVGIDVSLATVKRRSRARS